MRLAVKRRCAGWHMNQTDQTQHTDQMNQVPPLSFCLAVVLALAPFACASPPSPSLPEQPFAELTGPHSVGVRDFLFVEDRPEPFTADPDDRRRLLVRVWYPAVIGAEDEPAPYVPEPGEFGGAETFSSVLHVRTRGFEDAAPDPSGGSGGRYPVLLFNPGGGWTRLSDTFWTEQLASHGYVVFAVDHQGFNQTVAFPDGTRFAADQLAFPAEQGDLEADARAAWAHLEQHHFPLWLEDCRSLLDRIEAMAANEGDDLGRLLDVERIGAFGWSFGGALAVQLSRDDARIDAAVNGDGQLFGDVARTGTPRPVLLMHGEPDEVPPEQQEVLERLMAEVEGNFALLRERSPQVWEVTLRGASHGSFSDLVLAGPVGEGRLGAARGHEIINQLSLAFFGRHLKGEASPFLESVENMTAAFPEALDVHLP